MDFHRRARWLGSGKRSSRLCLRSVVDVVMGIGGAVGGGMMHAAGYSGTIVTTLFAAICAVLLTILAGFANGRKVYALQS